MDAVIRSARLAKARARLSDLVLDRSNSSDAADVTRSDPQSLQTKQSTWRSDMEKTVRSELQAQMAELCESERERARVEGYAAGASEAKWAMSEELVVTQQKLKSELDSALSAMALAYETLVSKLESSVGEVAFAAVCRLVGCAATSQVFVMGLVEQTCAQVRAETVATARMHPRDAYLLRDVIENQELRVRSLRLHVIQDESVRLGGCVIEAGSNQYDGGLENQLRRLHAVLLDGPSAGDSLPLPNSAKPAPDAET